MPLLIFFIFFVALLYFASRATQSTPPDAGNPKLPTVSQSRRIPLAVGKTKIDGPNVLEATPYQTTVNKVKSKGLFGSSSQEVGFSYYQNIEMAIAYGPGELYDIYWGDILGISPNFDGSSIQRTSISSGELFGDRKTGQGGVIGQIEFIPGDNAGYISRMEALTGRDQPGMPNLARVVFYDNPRGFYWGNSEAYKPVTFIYGFYPNPFNEATKHKIGNGANPAYVLYEIANSPLYGMGLLGNVNQSAIQTLADICVAEDLGIQRTWYESEGGAIERELLDFIDAVRFRDPDSGDIIYKALRDDFDVNSLPSLNDDNIEELEIIGPGLSLTATKVTVEYLDENRFFESVKVEIPNVANRIILNRDTAVNKDFYGAGNPTLATKLGTREARKATKGRKQGKLICDRTAWDWALGDTFLLTREIEGISNLPVRIVEHSKGTLQDGRVTIKWIEELFSFGIASYGTPVITVDQQITNPAQITNFYAFVLPVFLLNEEDAARYGIFAVQPAASSQGFFLYESGVKTTTNGYVWEENTIQANYGPLDSTIVINGSFNFGDIQVSNETVSLENGFNLVIVECSATGEHEIILFTGFTYDSNLNQTTLTGVVRGLIDTYPQPLTIGDKVWRYDDIEVNSLNEDPISNAFFQLADFNDSGEFQNPSSISVDLSNRYYKPLIPAAVRIDGSLFPNSVTGQIDLSWRNRSREHTNENGLDDWETAASRPLPTGTTTTVTFYNDDTNQFLSQTTGITGETHSYTPVIPSTNIRAEVRAVSSEGNSIMDFKHVFQWISTASTKRYWRIFVTDTETADQIFLVIAEIELRATVGGADQTGSGTAASSEFFAGLPASSAFDNNSTSIWSTDTSTGPDWISYDLVAGIDIAEVAITAGDNTARAARAPKDFLIQSSTDNANWTTELTVTNETGWLPSETRTFVI